MNLIDTIKNTIDQNHITLQQIANATGLPYDDIHYMLYRQTSGRVSLAAISAIYEHLKDNILSDATIESYQRLHGDASPSPSRPLVDLRQEIVAEMRRQGWTLRPLAAQTGIAHSTLAGFLHGRGLSIDNLNKLCVSLGLCVTSRRDAIEHHEMHRLARERT